MPRLTLSLIAMLLLCPLAGAKEISVTPNTIANAASQLNAGDTLLLQAGRYTAPIKLWKRKGTAAAPIVIRAAKGATVVLDGSDALDGLTWTKHKANIYKATLDADISQLFCDGKMMTAARWPNAHMTDEHFFNKNAAMRVHKVNVAPIGTIVDADASAARKHGSYEPLPEGRTNTQSLAASGIDATGCVAVMNIGSWMTFASRVTAHKPGESKFTYDATFADADANLRRIANELHPGKRFAKMNTNYWHDHYYFLEGLPCLDAPREYWYDHKTKTLYFCSPDGKSPARHALRGKRRDYMLSINQSLRVKVSGLDFIAAGFAINDSLHCTFSDAALYAPTHNKFQLGKLGNFNLSRVWNRRGGKSPATTGNVIRNCRFSFLDGEALYIHGRDTLVENCDFRNVNYSCLGFAYGVQADKAIVRHCTLARSGAAEGFRNGRVLEFNRVTNIGGLQHDGSAFQAGGRDQVIMRFNWVHDTSKLSYRVDSGSNPKDPNGFGQVYGNVAWKCRSYQIKGDDHLIANNVALYGSVISLNVSEVYKSTNDRTLSFNNIGPLASTKRGKKTAPGILKSNISLMVPAYEKTVPGRKRPLKVKAQPINPATVLRDPANWDFRPRPGTAAAKLGTPISAETLPKGFPAEWVDLAFFAKPAIGAYPLAAKRYWIPGYRAATASTPIPRNGGKAVPLSADLMWLEGYRSTKSVVYCGTNRATIETACEKSPLCLGTFTDSNIAKPAALKPATTYYWSVDAITPSGTIRKGPVWTFTTKE